MGVCERVPFTLRVIVLCGGRVEERKQRRVCFGEENGTPESN